MRYSKSIPVAVFALLLCSAVVVLSQTTPVIAGTWELDLNASNFGSAQKPEFTLTRQIAQNGSEIDVEDTITYPQKKEKVGPHVTPQIEPLRTEKETVTFDTTGASVPNMTIDGAITSSAKWQGKTLTISNKGFRSDQQPFTQDESWTLSPARDLLQIKQTTKSATFNNTATYVLRKVP